MISIPIPKATSQCPHCDVVVNWTIRQLNYKQLGGDKTPVIELHLCPQCDGYVVYERIYVPSNFGDGHQEHIRLYPPLKSGSLPQRGLPENLKKLYEEARIVAAASPRAAACLLRLLLDDLTIEICAYKDIRGGDLNDRINKLIRHDLPVHIGQAMECVRLIGNGGAHTNEMTEKCTAETIELLFDFINHIVAECIARPAAAQKLYGEIPAHKRKEALISSDGA